MKTRMITAKGRMLMIAIALSFVAAVASGQARADFSGTWVINEGKSQLGEGRMRMASSPLVVKQSGNNMSVERTASRQGGESTTWSEKYTLDGQTCVNTGRMNSPSKSVVTWAGNNRNLSFRTSQTFERQGQSMEITTTELWSLASDGKTLTIDATTSTQQGEMKRKLVYEKK
jgi:hypothetical protein